MPLETAQYIHQLEPSNPAGTDQLAQGDDHLRMIKQVLKATFPNITGPVTATQAKLNNQFTLPIGLINIWYGSSASVPSGWAICNGQTVARTDGAGNITTPDLRDRAVVGAGTLAAQGANAGSLTASATTGTAGNHYHTVSGGEHSHSGTVKGTALTEAQLPAHKHANGVVDNSDALFNHGGTAASPPRGNDLQGNNNGGTREGWTSTVGEGQTHTHGLTINASGHEHEVSSSGAHSHSVQVSTIQPVKGLHYIMKV